MDSNRIGSIRGVYGYAGIAWLHFYRPFVFTMLTSLFIGRLLKSITINLN
jgi:hypothetical protein